jgi:hypothetical protein
MRHTGPLALVAAVALYAGSRVVRRFGVGEMAAGAAETPVELDVTDRPTVNVVQEASWIELRLRYLVHPRRGTRTRNALYHRFDDNPDRVAFPIGRNR